MTEEEAKTKWCPFSRFYSSTGSFNRSGDGIDRASKCIGANCMAWRWMKDPLTDLFTHGVELPDYEGEHGYCGLAGKYYS